LDFEEEQLENRRFKKEKVLEKILEDCKHKIEIV
jgi:hypothetical protein